MRRNFPEMAATAGDMIRISEKIAAAQRRDPSPRQAWQQVIGLALAMIVAAFVLGYVVGKIG